MSEEKEGLNAMDFDLDLQTRGKKEKDKKKGNVALPGVEPGLAEVLQYVKDQ